MSQYKIIVAEDGGGGFQVLDRLGMVVFEGMHDECEDFIYSRSMCALCGYPIHPSETYCAECLCEDDCY